MNHVPLLQPALCILCMEIGPSLAMNFAFILCDKMWRNFYFQNSHFTELFIVISSFFKIMSLWIENENTRLGSSNQNDGWTHLTSTVGHFNWRTLSFVYNHVYWSMLRGFVSCKCEKSGGWVQGGTAMV